jgi:tetratricopeptide (TPR) repeat protein
MQYAQEIASYAPQAADHQQQQITELFKQGRALHQQGKLAQAKVIYEQVIAKHPEHADALHLLGLTAAQSKNAVLAVELMSKAIKINPNHATAHSNLGVVFKNLNCLDEALASCDRAIALEPHYADAHYNRGNVLRELRRLDEAQASYRRSIAIAPIHADVYSNLGIVLKDLDRLNEALACYDRAIALEPNYVDAHYNRGIALHDLTCFEAAVESYDRAITIKPNYAEAYYNRGIALKELNRLYEVVASYDRAIALKPDYEDAYWNKSLTLLLKGEFKRGWELYEWRWKREKLKHPQREFTQPLWLGAQDLVNKTILLHAEQGLGDTIQFCRYAKQVKALGARVLLEVPRALMDLLSELDGVDELLAKGDPLPTFDYQCPLMSLPLAFKTELHTIPGRNPYLFAADDKLALWSSRLGEKKELRVGLVWSGSATNANDQKRSLILRDLLPYLPKGCEYVSLQQEVRQVDKGALAGSAIRHFGDHLKDFSDTAALCDLMDVVVSVDTSVAHLAGALGKATWVLLPYVPDFRWLQDRNDSPWYQDVNLIRQDATRQWVPVLARMESILVQFAHNLSIDVNQKHHPGRWVEVQPAGTQKTTIANTTRPSRDDGPSP